MKTKKHVIKQLPEMDCITFNDVKYIREVEETFTITKEQIVDLQNAHDIQDVFRLTKEWFPKAFEPEKKELVVGVWYKGTGCNSHKLFCFNGGIDSDNDPKGYGFIDNRTWMKANNKGWGSNGWQEASQQEVEEALKAEILKRYKVGDRVNCLKSGNISLNCELNLDSFDHYFEDDELWVSFDEGEETDSMVCVYSNGIFAEIIRPKKMTKAEIETELGYNIEIV